MSDIDVLDTDEVIKLIQKAIDAHSPGTWDNGLRLAEYLHAQAVKIEESVADDMSARTD